MEEKRRYRSLFWPVFLIGVGITWLLSNMGLIPQVHLGTLLQLWPLLLIVAGLDMLFGRISPVVGAVIAVLAVAAVVVILVAAPALGLPAGAEVVTERLVEPVGQATHARVLLDLGSPRTTVQALVDSENLLDATVQHLGNARLTSSGVENRQVTLGTTPVNLTWFQAGSLVPRRWEVGLTPTIPLDLTIDSASGSGDFDLSQLALSSLLIDSGSGSIMLRLPVTEDSYTARVDSASGSVDIQVPCSNIEVRLDSGSGSVDVNTEAGCPLRVEVREGGSGAVNLPRGLPQLRGDRDEGAWETTDYPGAAIRLLIIMEDQGSGSFTVR
ncbi:MAG TPA: DUF5668 domain-containing protein [Levilinea sp.]|nr:DUF5668 domain-containing protein [Levilinea sp.]